MKLGTATEKEQEIFRRRENRREPHMYSLWRNGGDPGLATPLTNAVEGAALVVKGLSGLSNSLFASAECAKVFLSKMVGWAGAG